MGVDLVRKGVPEVVTLELRSAKQTREKVVFSTRLSCQGSVLGGGLRAEIAQAERKLEGREEEYDVDVAGKKAGPAGLCRTEELCLHPKVMGLKWVPSSQQPDVLAGVGLPREQHRWDMV